MSYKHSLENIVKIGIKKQLKNKINTNGTKTWGMAVPFIKTLC
jgi:hypothetical protein